MKMFESIYTYENNQADINRRFTEYLAGKSVAIVGRWGPQNLELGKHIDSHDVVVRIHNTGPSTMINSDGNLGHRKHMTVSVPESSVPFYGARADIWYHRIKGDVDEFIKRGIVDERTRTCIAEFKDNGGKFLCVDDPHPFPLRFIIPCLAMETRFIDLALYAHLGLLLKKQLVEPGIVIVCDILTQPIKSAYITGLPCYFDELSKEVYPPERLNGLQDINELSFINDLAKHDRVTVDPEMQSLFKKYVRK